MNIGEYLFEKLIEEKNLVEELINIDNKIQYTNLTYSEFIKKVKQIKVPKIGIRGLNNFITDGEPDTIFAIMMNMAPMVKKLILIVLL